MVSLKEFCKALGLHLTANKELATVDVSLPKDWGMEPAAAATPGRMGSLAVAPPPGPMTPVVVRTNTGETIVDVDQYLVRGRFNYVYFHSKKRPAR